MSLANRIKEAMGTRKPGEFAKSIHVSAAAVTQWMKGDIKTLKGETVAYMELETGYRASWICLGKGAKLLDEGNIRNISRPGIGDQLERLHLCIEAIDPDVRKMAKKAIIDWLRDEGALDETAAALNRLPKAIPSAGERKIDAA